MPVPRIIHQVYLSGELPPVLQRNVEDLKARNPGWEHRLYDHARAEALVSEYGGEVEQTYHRISANYPAARVDLLCNLIAHRYGGVYCDIKSTFERPLDEVIRPDDRYLIAQWGPAGEPDEGWSVHRDVAHIPGGEYVKFFIICEPGHPYSLAIVERIIRNVARYRPWSAVGRIGVLRTTGPIAYSLGLHPVLQKHPHRRIRWHEIGARPSIGGDYDHFAVFKNHYSLRTDPVVSLGLIGTKLSWLFVQLRKLHAAVKMNRHRPIGR